MAKVARRPDEERHSNPKTEQDVLEPIRCIQAHFGHRLAGLWLGRYTAGWLQGSRLASVADTTGGSRVRANSSVGGAGSAASSSHITGERPKVSCLPCTWPVNLRAAQSEHGDRELRPR